MTKNIAWFFILVPLLIVGIWFRSGHQLGTAEGGIPFNNLTHHAHIFRYAWADTALGNTTSISTAAFPTYYFLSYLEKLRFPPFLIEALVFFTILSLALIAVFLISREILELSLIGSINTALFYLLSPFVVVNIFNRFLYNHIFFLAFFPWLIYFTLKGITKSKYSYALMMGLLTLVFSYSLSALALTVMSFGTVIAIILYYSLFIKSRKDLLFNLTFFVLFIASFLFLNLWWINQLFMNLKVPINSNAETFFSINGNLETLTILSSKLGNFNDLARFLHHTFYFSQSATFSYFYTTKIGLIISSLILGTILCGIFLARKSKILSLFSLVFLVSIFFEKGNSPPFGEIFTTLFTSSSIVQLFRNPFEKIGLLSVLSGAILFSFAIELLSHKFARLKVNLSVLVILVLFWGYPYLTDQVFNTYKWGTKIVQNYQTEVPEYYVQLNEFLNANVKDNRFLAMPFLGEGISYAWETPYSGIDIYSTLFDKQNISFNTTIPFYEAIVGSLSKYQLEERFISFLPYLSVDQIVLRKDVDFKDRGYPNPIDSEAVLIRLEQDKKIKKINQFGKLDLYELNSDLIWGKAYLSEGALFSNETDAIKLMPEDNLENKKIVFLPINYYSKYSGLSHSLIVYPKNEKLFAGLKEYMKFSIEDLYAHLLFTKHSPDEIFYPLIRSKELVTSLVNIEYPKWVYFNTSLLGKRASEICKVAQSKQGGDLNKLKQDYLVELNRQEKYINDIFKNKQNYAKDIEDSLLFQFLLLDKCQVIPFGQFTALLTRLKIFPMHEISNDYNDQILEYYYDFPSTQYYRVNVDESFNYLYFDGYPLKKLIIDEDGKKLINISKGVHTVSLRTEDSKWQTVLEVKDLTLDNQKDWSKEFKLESGYQYKIDFDYQTQAGDYFGIYLRQNIDTPTIPKLFEGITLKKNQFQARFLFTPSIGATNAQLGLTGDKNKFCQINCPKHKNLLQAKVKNLNVGKKRIEPIAFYNGHIESTSSGKKTAVRKVSPVEYEITFNKSTDQPQILVFSEIFSNGWTISGQGDFGDHILVNGFANGWIVNKKGDYKARIYFTPQKLLDMSMIASFLTAVFLTTTLVVLKIKYEKKRN